jgi:hypothetical protein
MAEDLIRSVAAAGSSAVITVTGIHPIDVVKTRLQVSGQGTRNYKALGISGTVKTIFKEEGIQAFWKGIGAAWLREASYTSLRLGLYSPIKKVMNVKNDSHFFLKFTAGSAAGGIGSGRSMLAAMVLGADAVQIGSRYICTPEASSHLAFKEAIIHTQEGDTELSLKQLTPVRLIKNEFYQQVKQAEEACADKESLKNILGKGRAKLGMFEGNLVDGELEVGQVGAMIKDIIPAGELTQQIWQEFVNLGYKLFP